MTEYHGSLANRPVNCTDKLSKECFIEVLNFYFNSKFMRWGLFSDIIIIFSSVHYKQEMNKNFPLLCGRTYSVKELRMVCACNGFFRAIVELKLVI